MEVTKTYLFRWHEPPDYVKGNKSHQFVSSAGPRIYFDSDGEPRNTSDDTLVTDLETFFATSSWQWEHYFNITPANIGTAISAYKSGPIGTGVMFEIMNTETNQTERYYYWKSGKPVELMRRSRHELFTIDELLSGTWYICTDAY